MRVENSKNKAKSLKLGKNDIICPQCNTVLNIPEEIISDEYIQCNKCEAAIINPFSYRKPNNDIKIDSKIPNDTKQKQSSNTDSDKQVLWYIGLAFAFIIVVIIFIVNQNNSSSSASSSSSLYTVNTTTYGATSENEFDHMFVYILNNDKQALSSLIQSGKIRTIAKGTDVYLIKSKFASCKIRVKGNTQELWIANEFITKK